MPLSLLGRQVEFVYYDDQTQPANLPKIYTKRSTPARRSPKAPRTR